MATSASFSWYDALLERVRELSKPPSTKIELIAHYQKHYAPLGKKGSWKQRITGDLARITGLKQKNLEKRFDTQRINNPEMGKTARQYKMLGDMIGPQSPEHGYHVEFDGWLNFSNDCEKRKFSVDITGTWAQQVTEAPRRIIDAMLLIYMEEDAQDLEIDEHTPSIGICQQGDTGAAGENVNDPKIILSANKEPVKQGHSGRRRRWSFFAGAGR